MSSISTTYMDLCIAEQEYRNYMYDHILHIGSEGVVSSITDTIIRFFKKLKYYISSIISRLMRYIGRRISYSDYISARNLSRARKIDTIYRKHDATTQLAIDNAFLKVKMSDCWDRDTFIRLITDFSDMCVFGNIDLYNALQSDINNITNPTILNNSNIAIKLAMFESKYGLSYTGDKNNPFKLVATKYASYTNKTFRELNFSSIESIIEIVNSYEKSLIEYKKLIKLPNTLDRLEYELDTTIRDVQQDPLIADSVKNNLSDIEKLINNSIKSVRQYLDVINGIVTSINTRISSMLAKCHAVLDKRNIEGSESSVYCKKTTIVVTSDEKFNKNMKDCIDAHTALCELVQSSLYSSLKITHTDATIDKDESIKSFCKGESSTASALLQIPTTILSDEQYTDIIEEFMIDANTVIKHTSLSVSLSETGLLYFIHDEHIPDMTIAINRAKILTYI